MKESRRTMAALQPASLAVVLLVLAHGIDGHRLTQSQEHVEQALQHGSDDKSGSSGKLQRGVKTSGGRLEKSKENSKAIAQQEVQRVGVARGPVIVFCVSVVIAAAILVFVTVRQARQSVEKWKSKAEYATQALAEATERERRAQELVEERLRAEQKAQMQVGILSRKLDQQKEKTARLMEQAKEERKEALREATAKMKEATEEQSRLKEETALAKEALKTVSKDILVKTKTLEHAKRAAEAEAKAKGSPIGDVMAAVRSANPMEGKVRLSQINPWAMALMGLGGTALLCAGGYAAIHGFHG